MARIVMLGSDFEVRGGVSAMARVCAAHGLFERWDALYLATHCDGPWNRKLACAARAWLRFMGLLLTGRVALVHAHVNSGASFWRKALFLLPAWALRVPFVMQVHCGRFAEFHGASRLVARTFIGWLLRRASRVVALSQRSRIALERIEPAIRVDAIPNPVNLPPQPAPVAADPPCALFLGMVTEAKGAFDLLRAWAAVHQALPQARLVMAGAGELEAAAAVALVHGFAASLELPGWVDTVSRDALMQRATLLVLPSRWEAMPMAVLEAMAAGLPVVATRVGGVPDVVDHGENGLLVEARDINVLSGALLGLLRDPQTARALGAAARERASADFSADVVVPRIEALWSGLLRRTDYPRPGAEPMGHQLRRASCEGHRREGRT